MSNHEHLTASEIVAQFGDEIRAAINAVAAETPRVIKDVARTEVNNRTRKSQVTWYLASMGATILISLATCWLMLNYAPRIMYSGFSIQRGPMVEYCTRAPTSSDGDAPLYICVNRYVDAPTNR